MKSSYGKTLKYFRQHTDAANVVIRRAKCRTPTEIYTDSYISFRVNSEGEAESLLSYLKTDFVNHMLSIRKISQDICENTCKWIPLVPLDRIWSDDKVCEYLKIDKTMYI